MTMTNTILNKSLELALKHTGEPIQKHLSKSHPDLSARDLETYATTCNEVIEKGYKLADETLSQAWKAKGWERLEDIDTRIVYSAFTREIKQHYPWLSKDTMSSLFSRGIYAALK
jgi:hypothetical protein